MKWAQEWQMYNPRKTEFLMITKQNTQIPLVDHVKYLGHYRQKI